MKDSLGQNREQRGITANLIKAVFIVTFISLQAAIFIGINSFSHSDKSLAYSFNGLDLEYNKNVLVPAVNEDEIKVVNEQKTLLLEKERVAQIRQDKINGLVKFLKKWGSPVATNEYAAQIIDLSEKNHADYKIIVAIMGVESGFCRVPVKKNGTTYNCFGYLNGVKYQSFTAAFNDLVPKISKQYANKYGWNFEALAKAYGQMGWEKTSHDMAMFANGI